MSSRKLSRAIALLFLVGGGFLLWLSGHDPQPRSAREVSRGVIEASGFRRTSSQEEWCGITLEGDPREFVVKDLVGRDAALRAELATRLALGALVEFESVPLKGGAAQGPGGEARQVLRLMVDGALVYDAGARHGAGLGVLRFALGAAGALAMVLGARGMWVYRPQRR